MTRLSGKRALLIGASSGIGRACAFDFIRNGANVVVADINPFNGCEGAAGHSEPDIVPNWLQCDVTDEQSVRRAVESAEQQLEGLDTLVFFAGMMRTGKVEAFSGATWDEIFQVNARGTFYAAKYAVPALRRSGGGSITTTSSLAGVRGGPGITAYSSAKGAVIAFTSALALEVASDNIRVNCVLPGWIDTPFNNPAIEFMGGIEAQKKLIRQTVPLGHQGTPSDVAPMYVFLASDEARFITAKSMMVDGGQWS